MTSRECTHLQIGAIQMTHDTFLHFSDPPPPLVWLKSFEAFYTLEFYLNDKEIVFYNLILLSNKNFYFQKALKSVF